MKKPEANQKAQADQADQAGIYRRVFHCHPATPEQLALIAAPLMQRHGGDCKAAIAEAARLWAEAIIQAPELGVLDFWGTSEKDIPKPERFPVTIEEMLRLLLPQVDNAADRQKEFRHFLACQPIKGGRGEILEPTEEDLVEGGEHLAKLRQREINEIHYHTLGRQFLAWREKRKSSLRSKASRRKRGKRR